VVPNKSMRRAKKGRPPITRIRTEMDDVEIERRCGMCRMPVIPTKIALILDISSNLVFISYLLYLVCFLFYKYYHYYYNYFFINA